jgi:alkylated DNA repair dioxygenase AlkB
VSFGATRRFQLRRTAQKDVRRELDLVHGSLLVMRGATQRLWQHQVPKTSRPVGPRINLTFRTIV